MLEDDAFRRLLDHLNRPWAGFRKVRKGVKKRIRRHMHELDCDSIDAYLHDLDASPEALAACNRHLRVTISRFFRDRRLWAYLRDCILPDMVSSLQGPVRAWSAGCANGEEPYSLAILWEQQETNQRLVVTATDASGQLLTRAQTAKYGPSSLKQVPDDLKQHFFEKPSAGRQYTLRPLSKSVIHWQRHELLDDPIQGPFHLIFLRNNLLTYYQGDSQRNAFNRIISSLAPQGYLIVGSHEHLPPQEFELRRHEACQWIYQLP